MPSSAKGKGKGSRRGTVSDHEAQAVKLSASEVDTLFEEVQTLLTAGHTKLAAGDAAGARKSFERARARGLRSPSSPRTNAKKLHPAFSRVDLARSRT